jgi:mannose-1-phosphate guanylyltransferase
MNSIVSVIAAGGLSSRLFPLTDGNHPKWLLNIGGSSLLQQTIDRINTITEVSQILVITNINQRKLVPTEIEKQAKVSFFSEPTGRNTYATFVLGAYLASKIDPNSKIVFSPADHLINDIQKYQITINSALDKVNQNIVVCGLLPSFPATDYGYINGDGNQVWRFVEKPDQLTAEQYLLEGNYYWNSGIFVTSTSFVLSFIENHDEETIFAIKELVENQNYEKWNQLNSISVDYQLIEPLSDQNKIAMVKATFDWSDVGGFSELKNTQIFDIRKNE